MTRSLRMPFALLLAAMLGGVVTAADVDRRRETEPTRLPVTEKDIERDLGTAWYGVYVLGQKCGHARIELARVTENGASLFRESFKITLKLTAMDQKIEMRMHETNDFSAKPPFRLLRSTSFQTDGKSVQKVELTRKQNGFEAVVTSGTGKKDQRKLDVGQLDYTIADALGPSLWIRTQPKIGDKIAFRSLDLDKLRLGTETIELVGTKPRTVDGVRVKVFEVKMTDPDLGLTMPGTVDEDGRLVSMRVGGLFEIRLEPEKVAKDTKYSADLFEHGLVRTDKPLGADPATIVSLELEVIGGAGLSIPSGPNQRFETDADEKKTFFRLGKKFGQAVKATEKETRENLRETVQFPINNRRIQKLAGKATAGAKTPREKVRRLLAFVSEFIEDSYHADQLTVSDILKNKRGDCTEHALLFITLARAARIPARELGGLVYMGDEVKAFGPHAWCEVVLDGVWIPVDPTWDELDINATHISFGSRADDQFQILAQPKGLLLKVLRVGTDEKREGPKVSPR